MFRMSKQRVRANQRQKWKFFACVLLVFGLIMIGLINRLSAHRNVSKNATSSNSVFVSAHYARSLETTCQDSLKIINPVNFEKIKSQKHVYIPPMDSIIENSCDFNHNSNNNVIDNINHNRNQLSIVVSIAMYDNPDPMVLNNHKNYCIKHNYFYFALNKAINPHVSPYYQKAYIIELLMFNQTFVEQTFGISNIEFEYLHFIDFDALFINFDFTILDIMNIAANSNKLIQHSKDLSFVFTGGWGGFLCSGSMLFHKNDYTLKMIKLWQLLEETGCFPQDDDQVTMQFVVRNVSNADQTLQKLDDLQKRYKATNSEQDRKAIEQYVVFKRRRYYNLFIDQYITDMNSNNDDESNDWYPSEEMQKHAKSIKVDYMNANVWSMLNNDISFMQNNFWILHFAGRGKAKQKLLELSNKIQRNEIDSHEINNVVRMHIGLFVSYLSDQMAAHPVNDVSQYKFQRKLNIFKLSWIDYSMRYNVTIEETMNIFYQCGYDIHKAMVATQFIQPNVESIYQQCGKH